MVSGNTRGLELNVAPIKLSNEDILVGKQDVSGDKIREKLDELRSKYWRSHAFRYDNRVKVIYDVPIIPDVSPIGTSTEVPVQENLLLVAKAIQQSILVWIEAKGTPILQAGKRLTFLGLATQAMLLTQ